jgi:uncharacterized membrane protein YeaQ/YmgE (transglycosylase-associated protein family)
MSLSNESLVFIILVGIFAGWLAGRLVDGGGFGLVGDLIVGVVGAFIGDWLLPRLGINLGSGTLALIINATLGAIVLLVLLRLVARAPRWGGGGGWGGRWRRRW